MKKLLLSVIMLLPTLIKAQNVVYDDYIIRDLREIKTEEITVPNTDENIVVKLCLVKLFHTTIKPVTYAYFTIDFKNLTTGTISPYNFILKTSKGEIIEAYDKLAEEVYDFKPEGWRRLEWHVSLNKKNLKNFTNENIVKIRLAVGYGTYILDINLLDETLTNYIKDAYDAIAKQSKIKLDESKNPSKYKGF